MFLFGLLVTLENKVHSRGVRKFRRSAKAAILDVELLRDGGDLRFDHAGVELRTSTGEHFRLRDRIGQMVCRLNKIGSLVAVRIRNCQEKAAKAGAPHLIFRRKIRPAKEWFSVGQQKSRQRPASLTGN